MRFRTHRICAAAAHELLIAVVAFAAFSTVSAGVDSTLTQRMETVPAAAAIVGLGILIFLLSVSIDFFRGNRSAPGTAGHSAAGTTGRSAPGTAASAKTASTTAGSAGPVIPTGLFHPGEIEFAHLRSQPPFDTDHLILTDRRIMRVATDATGSVIRLSQAAPWQVASARAEASHDRATVTVELHIGSSMRLEETAPEEAHRFVTTITEVAARSRA